jgi:protein phosphatase
MLGSDDDTERVPVTESMIAAVQKANADIIAQVPDGGTTLTAVAVIGDLAYVAHVGDSRIYLVTKDSIEQITRDHSLVQRYVELKLLTPEEASVHAQKNVLYRALGQSESLEVDALTRRLPPNSKLMLCSDGLWNLVTEEEIADIISNHSNPQEACDKLVALANAHGGTDNITVILLRIPAH